MDNLYREEILEHFREPHNFGKLNEFNRHSRQLNPFCGDEIEMFSLINNGIFSEISFLGKGCVISIYATSVFTDFVKKKKLSELTKFGEEDMLGLLGIEVSDSRKKCAFLGLAVFKDSLAQCKA